MNKPASLAQRLNHAARQEKASKPVEITEIVDGAQGTAAYIAQMTGELVHESPASLSLVVLPGQEAVQAPAGPVCEMVSE